MENKNMAAGDEIAEQLRNEIISGKLKPRQRLIEMELSRQYSVSRTPIREAIRNLEAAGLVKVEPYKGAVVADVDVEEIREIYEVRACLEGMAAGLAASAMTQEILQELEGHVLRMEKSSVQRNLTEFTKENDMFHKTVYGHCGNKVLVGMIDDLLAKSVIFRRSSARSRKNLELVNQTHRALLEALKLGDAEQARQVMQAHIRLSIKGISDMELDD